MTSDSEERTYGGKWPLAVCISGLKLLGGIFCVCVSVQKKTTKTKTQWEMPLYGGGDFKSRPPNEPAIRISHYALVTF